jgi:hypothetical protein
MQVEGLFTNVALFLQKHVTSPKWEIFYKILNSTPQNCPDHEKVNTNYSHRPKVTKET